MSAINGRHFLQIPGPTNVPDRVLRAIDNATIDHRGPEFQKLGQDVLAKIRQVFKTKSPVVIFPASGTGAWEAALVNTLSPGDKVLMYETGQFATLWKNLATRLGLQPEFIGGDWRRGIDATQIEAKLNDDKAHAIKAVCVVHNETSTGVTSKIAEVRKAIDRAQHPALLDDDRRGAPAPRRPDLKRQIGQVQGDPQHGGAGCRSPAGAGPAPVRCGWQPGA